MGKNKVEGNPNLYFSFFLLIGKSLPFVKFCSHTLLPVCGMGKGIIWESLRENRNYRLAACKSDLVWKHVYFGLSSASLFVINV